MTQLLKPYRVTAMMYVPLFCYVEAIDESHALALARKLAESGELNEEPFAGDIDNYDATELLA